MIIQRHRFHGYGSLKGVYGRGQTVRGGALNLKFVNRGPSRPYRVAVVVSRKVSKSAVTRNRIRRRVYEIIRKHEAAVPANQDLVFTAFSEQLADLPSSQLEALVLGLVQKAGG